MALLLRFARGTERAVHDGTEKMRIAGTVILRIHIQQRCRWLSLGPCSYHLAHFLNSLP